MGCTIIGLDSKNCVETIGGIEQTAIIDLSKVLDITFDSNGVVTAFVLDTGAVWTKFVYDDDDSAYFNQEGQRDGQRITYEQKAFLKFSGIDATKIQSANGMAGCCNGLIAIHYLNNGLALVQGVDYFDSTTGWRFTKNKLRMTPNVKTDTADNSDVVEFNLDSVGRKLAPTTSLTMADLGL